MKRRIAIIVSATLVLLTLLSVFAACTDTLTADEAAQLLKASVEESKEQSGWFVKHKTFFSDGTTEEFRLYVKGVQSDSVCAQYDHTVDRIVSTSTEYLYFGNAKKADSDASATGMLSWQGEGTDAHWALDESVSFDDFVADERIAPYTIDAVCEYASGIGEEGAEIISATRKGWVVYIFVDEVTRSDSPLYGCKDIEIRITKDRFSNVYFTDAQGRTVQINIVYGEGRVLTLPEWK